MGVVDVAQVLADNPLPALLRRAGVDVPDAGPGVRDEWRCHCPLPSHPVPADPSRPKPSFAVHLSGRMAGRWHCFACQSGGDAIALVQAYAQVGFRDAVGLIEAGGPLPRGDDPHLHLRPATRTHGGQLSWEATAGSDREPPDLGRTPPARLYEAMAVAWWYYGQDGPARLARRYLAERSIDLGALEASEGRPLAGHTPRSRTGLVEYLHRLRFSDDEAVDAGLVSRHPDGRVEDFFTHRLLLPVRDAQDWVVGLIGRDVSGGLRAKYLNTPRTGIYDKGRQLYRPGRGTSRSRENLVVVEGAIDALAIDSAAARVGLEIAAVSPSGVALTAEHRAQVAAWATGPPVLCADGDDAGRGATRRWVTEMTLAGREVLAVTLPDPYDPADWLAKHGTDGLGAFLASGWPTQGLGEVGPVHAGRHLASTLARENMSIATLVTTLAQFGGRLGDVAERERFALQAAKALAESGLGPDGWLERQVVSALATPWHPGGRSNDVELGNRGLAI